MNPDEPDAATGALRLLDRESPADYLREWTERIAAEKVVADEGITSALIFRIGVELLALPTPIFQQVAEQCPAHSLPHRTDGIVTGIVNIRGELFICASLGSVLGIEEEPEAKRESGRRVHGRLLLANRAGNRLAFPVDEVLGVHRYHPREMLPAPATLAESKVTYTIGLLPWRDRTVGCLDDELLFYTLGKSLS